MNGIKIDRIVRSRRRTIALAISPDATLTVRAPFGVSLDFIRKLVSEKEAWIEKRKTRILKNGEPPKPKEFINGEEFYYLGVVQKLQFENRKGLGLQARREKVIGWFKKQALLRITERAEFFANQTGWKFSKISISQAESRWGSCSAKNAIRFSWKLIMAPLEVIDYVVVHELAHIPEKNHSARFWAKVSSVIPDWKIRRKWLRDNGNKFRV